MPDVKQLKMRIAAIGKTPKWLSEVTDYTYSSIRHALSEKSPNKSDKILKALEAKISEVEIEMGKKSFEDKGFFSLDFTHNEFAQVDQASRLVNAISIKDYCKEAVMLRTRELMKRNISPAPIAHIVEVSKKGDDIRMTHEIPLLRAAAGSPLLSDAEMVEVDREHGKGRFMVELRGDSMEPMFQDKQRIIMRSKDSLKKPVLKYGYFYAFVVDGKISFKQWAKGHVLRSLNPEYEDITVDEDTDWVGWYDKEDNQ